MDKDKFIIQHYEKGVEKERLTQDKANTIEFITTTKYIDKYLKANNRILEIGAGTGIYSLHYAEKGYQVDSIELVKYNIDIFKARVKDNMNISINQGNAIDLRRYEDNTFDITLVLGPLYHLVTVEDRTKAITEAIRVTKPDGYIFIAYITHGSIILSDGLSYGNLLGVKRLTDEEYRFKDLPEEIFMAYYIDEFENFMESFNCEFVKDIATDGVAEAFTEKINALTDEEFNIWLDYHLKTCERKDIQGYSSHMLYICKK